MKENYIKDLKEIKDIMNRSSRFISLSGLSGVITGIIALVGVYLAYSLLFANQDYLQYEPVILSTEKFNQLLIIAVGTIMASVIGAIFFTRRNASKKQENIWDAQTKRLLINLLIPLVAGGLICLQLLFKGFIGLMPPLTLVFYGLALVNASKYSLPEIRNLGIIEIIIGILCLQFIEYGLWFWALGFGIVQVIYGLMVHKKYEK